jgi:phage terminase small subunit
MERGRSMLTAKQEKFIQNIVAGMTQRQAYKDAYDAENMTDNSIDVEACKLFNNPNVALRYKELLEKLEHKAIMTALDKRKMLKEIAESSENSVLERLKAVDIDNKMAGEYVTKVQGDVTINKLEDLL